jgi:chromosome segregation ATPase
LQERLTAAVTEAVASAEAAADEAQQQIRALQEEAAGLRATNTALHTALEEVHAAAASYQVRWLTRDCSVWVAPVLGIR